MNLARGASVDIPDLNPVRVKASILPTAQANPRAELVCSWDPSVRLKLENVKPGSVKSLLLSEHPAGATIKNIGPAAVDVDFAAT